MTPEEAAIKCEQMGIQRTEGKGPPEIPSEAPIATAQLSDEETELSRCIKGRMEAHGESEEQAREWCTAEKSGEHEAVDAMIARGNTLLKLRQQRDIQRKKQARRHPLQ